MTFDKDAAKQILSCIDRNELARLGCDLASIPSPTGEEKAIAEYILAWFAEHGIKPVRQDVAPDRPNAPPNCRPRSADSNSRCEIVKRFPPMSKLESDQRHCCRY